MELKHIAPYLPYKTIGISKQGTFFYLSTGCNMRGNGIEDRDIGTWVSNGIKPILHPLSDLTKEIEHNGERFVPMEEMLRANKHEFKELPLITKCETKIYERDNDTFCTIEYLNNDKSVSSFSYSSQYRRFIDRNETYGKPYATPYQYDLFEMLYKWKFDIFNLIEKGEAINVNTLQTNPYK